MLVRVLILGNCSKSYDGKVLYMLRILHTSGSRMIASKLERCIWTTRVLCTTKGRVVKVMEVLVNF
jgi:hypothetical protein